MSTEISREQLKRKIEKPARFQETPDKELVKKKKKSKGVVSSKANKRQSKKGSKKSDAKGKKKPKIVKKSAVLVCKKRSVTDSVLDKNWRSKIALQNSFLKSSVQPSKKTGSCARTNIEQRFQSRKNRYMEEDDDCPEVDAVAPDLLTALHKRVNYYREGDKILAVPSQFRISDKKMSKRTMNRDRTGFNMYADAFRPAVNEVIVAPVVAQCREALPQQPGTSYGLGDNIPGNAPPEGETLTYENLIARIPTYIRQRQDRGSKIMYVLRMIYSQEEIAQCSLTGKKSPYPSFETKYGSYRIGLFYRIVTEYLLIDRGQIATLICKRINYIRNSPRILRVAQARRSGNPAIGDLPSLPGDPQGEEAGSVYQRQESVSNEYSEDENNDVTDNGDDSEENGSETGTENGSEKGSEKGSDYEEEEGEDESDDTEGEEGSGYEKEKSDSDTSIVNSKRVKSKM